MTVATHSVGARLVFVVGARRSGTNWVQRVLCAHPDVVGTAGESFLFSRGLVPLVRRFHHGSPTAAELGSVFANRERVVESIRGLCDVVFGDLLTILGPAEKLVDRTPENVECLDLIGEVYPDAHVLHVIRDGRDVARSLLSMPWGPADAEAAADEWLRAVVDGRRQGAQLRHYREISYEEMLADPEPVITDVFGWLGLPLSSSITAAAMAEAQRAFVVDPKMSAVATGKWREGLDPIALDVVTTVAGDALAELGYVTGETPPRVRRPGRAAAIAEKLRARRRREPVDAEWIFRDRLQVANWLANRFLSELATGRIGDLEAVLDADVTVRLASDAMEYDGRGPEAKSRLLETLEADGVFQRPQRRGQVLAGVPTTTIYLSYEGPGGDVEQRVLSLTVRADRISGVTYFRPGSS